MTELEVRAGEGLERQLDRYARVRLDPSTAQAKRARSTVMEAAWRRRIAGPAPSAPMAAAVSSPPRGRGLFAGWGPRRLGASLAAAVLAGLLVGSTAFAASRAGGPLYDVRLALEEATLPTDPSARLEAELAMAQGRLAEIVEGIATDDPQAVIAAVRGYLAALEELGGAEGIPADRAQIAVAFHRTVLLDVLARVPEDARAGIETALANSGKVIDRLNAAGTTPETNDGGTSGGGGAGQGSGGTSGGSGASGGQGVDKPSKDPTPAKSPPAKSPQPAVQEPTRTPKPKPEPPTRVEGEAPDDEGDQGDEQP